MPPVKLGGNSGTRRTRGGNTLVEVMIACLVLATLVVGGGALYQASWAEISVARNKRAALAEADRRLEILRAVDYGQLQPADDDLYYLSEATGWTPLDADPDERITINGLDNYPVTTTVRYGSLPGGPADSHLVLRVSVAYRRATPQDRVVLETLRAP